MGKNSEEKRKKRGGSDISVLLHNIRSAHNVGSIFRTADAIGVTKIFLSGFTPQPIDRFGRPVREIAKTALGAELSIPWKYRKTPERILNDAKGQQRMIIGIEQGARAVDYKTFTPHTPVLVVVGNEVRGLSPSLAKKCDVLIEIPMFGHKESLNVSVAFGIAMFRLFDK